MVARVAKPTGETADIQATPEAFGQKLILAAAPGDLIDVIWQQTHLVVETLPHWVLANAAPTVASNVEVLADEGLEMRVAAGTGSQRSDSSIEKDTDDGRTVYRLTARDLAAIPSETGLSDPQHDSPWLLAVLESTLLDGRTTVYADSWQTVGRRVRSTLKPTLEVDDETRQQLNVGLAKARMRKLMRILRPSTNNAAPLTKAPLPFAQLKNGGASAIEAAAVAAAVTKGSMEEGHIALVVPHQGPLLFDELPGLYAFRAAAVAFHTSEGWRFADLTCSTCEFGKLPANLAGGRALILTDEPSIVDIPPAAVHPNRQEMLLDWTLAIDGQLSGSLVVKLEGQIATQAQAIVGNGWQQESQRDSLRKLLLGTSSGISINGIASRASMLLPGEPFEIDATVTASAKKSPDGGYTLTPLTIAGNSVSWNRIASPGAGAMLPAPAQIVVTSLVHLPPFFGAKMPPKRAAHRPFGSYSSTLTQGGNVITLIRKLNLTTRDVAPGETDATVTFATELDTADLETITITAED